METPRKIVIVFARDHEQYRNYAKQQQRQELRTLIFVSRISRIVGVEFTSVIQLEGWQKNEDGRLAYCYLQTKGLIP